MLNLRDLNVSRHDFSQYRLASTTGTLAAALAADAQLFYVRWTSTTHLFVLHRFRASFQALTAFTAVTLTDFGFNLRRATAVTAGGGGTDLGASIKTRMKTSMAASQLDATGAVRIATTGALTPITTLDALSIAQSLGDAQRANPDPLTEEPRVNDPTLLYETAVDRDEHPLILSQGEGLVLANRAAWPVDGTGLVQVEMVWSEIPR